MRDEPQHDANAPSDAMPTSGKPSARRTAKPKAGAKSGTKSGTKAKATRPVKDTVAITSEFADVDPLRMRQQLERQMTAVSRLLQEQNFETDEEVNAFLQQLMAQGGPIETAPTTPLEKAKELVYQAAEAKGKRREKLLREALALSPDCADAYVMMAESTRDPQEALRLFDEGMRAGEQALGDIFPQLVADGAFWGYIESRPYMRARQGLADVLWAMGEREAAIGHLQEMLRLNPNDNQGVRYSLISWLLIVGDSASLKSADKLLTRFREDASAFWAYSRLLLTLKRKGPGRAAETALINAMTTNPFVPFFLLGALSLPKQAPEFYGMGDQNEAIVYLDEGGGEAWVSDEQSVIWLAETIVRLAPPEALLEAELSETEPDEEPRPRGRPRKRP